MSRTRIVVTAVITIMTLLLSIQAFAADKITIGWAPPDITGVFKTATDYFEQSAEDAGCLFGVCQAETRLRQAGEPHVRHRL